MKVILVSGRYDASGDRRGADAAFAGRLVAIGCDVRLIVPGPTCAAAPEIDGVRVIAIDSKAPGFAAVERRLLDPVLEAAVSRETRGELPDLVHLLDYGGATSVNASWVASRLGAPVVVSLRAAPTLCHRGDLVHVDGSPCSEWLDPVRCAACCQRASPGGLSPLGAVLARSLTTVGWPLHPYPTAAAFENRRELLLGGLQVVDRICVDGDAEREGIVSLGVRPGGITILPRTAPVEDWRATYAALA